MANDQEDFDTGDTDDIIHSLIYIQTYALNYAKLWSGIPKWYDIVAGLETHLNYSKSMRER